jgi:hypothetical protein
MSPMILVIYILYRLSKVLLFWENILEPMGTHFTFNHALIAGVQKKNVPIDSIKNLPFLGKLFYFI